MKLFTLIVPALLSVTSFANETPCESHLASIDEALATIHFDLSALDRTIPRTVHDFVTLADEKVPTVRAMAPLRDGSTVDPRRLEIIRGYGRFLSRRRKHLGLFYNREYLWTEPATGVVYDLASGDVRETLAVSVSLGGKVEPYRTLREGGRQLRYELITHLIGDQTPMIEGAELTPPTWASISSERLANAHLLWVLLKFDDLATDDERVDLRALRLRETYLAELERLTDFKRLVDGGQPEGVRHGRLIYDMRSRGFGPEWMESLEVHDILEDLKPLTRGTYAVTLFWDSKTLIEVTDGVVRTYSP